MSVYDFEVKDGDGNMVSLSEFKDKALLIVNSAPKCGFAPQYTELNEIYNEFKDEGFEILDFPATNSVHRHLEAQKKLQRYAATNGWYHTKSSIKST